MREMPTTVRSALAEKIETMTGEEAVAAADHYFDKNGKFMHATQTVVNHVGSCNQNEVNNGDGERQNSPNCTGAFTDNNEGDVNAIRPQFRG